MAGLCRPPRPISATASFRCAPIWTGRRVRHRHGQQRLHQPGRGTALARIRPPAGEPRAQCQRDAPGRLGRAGLLRRGHGRRRAGAGRGRLATSLLGRLRRSGRAGRRASVARRSRAATGCWMPGCFPATRRRSACHGGRTLGGARRAACARGRDRWRVSPDDAATCAICVAAFDYREICSSASPRVRGPNTPIDTTTAPMLAAMKAVRRSRRNRAE